MQPSYLFTHGGSMAPRSERVLLSRPSSLPGHSDSPNVHDRLLPVSSGLQVADRRRSVVKHLTTLRKRRGLRFSLHVSVLACHRPYSGFLTGACSLSFPVNSGFPSRRRRSACIPPLAGFSRNRTLPAISVRSHFTKLHRSRDATACEFDEHPWPGTTHRSMSLRDTVSGHVRPRCYHLNPPSVYAPEREIGATVTFTLQET